MTPMGDAGSGGQGRVDTDRSETATSMRKSSGSIHLVRSSTSWTEANSAAGFVLRYLVPLRQRLTSVLGSQQEADEAIKILINHLVAAGFGQHNRGRLRDFLMKGIRSAAKARWKQIPRADRPDEPDSERMSPEDPEWIVEWREGLLERAWRSLERREHACPDRPVYTVLRASFAAPSETAEMLAVRVASDTGMAIDADRVTAVLSQARVAFAQAVADDVAETLHLPEPADVRSEIRQLGLAAVFRNLAG